MYKVPVTDESTCLSEDEKPQEKEKTWPQVLAINIGECIL